jgi:hypothetical protein
MRGHNALETARYCMGALVLNKHSMFARDDSTAPRSSPATTNHLSEFVIVSPLRRPL